MSIIKQKKQRVAIFIDAQNLYHSARSLYGCNVNFKNILEDTLVDRELVRAIAYVIATESGEEKNFFEALKKAGIETKSKDLQVFLGGAKKGDWDVGMTVDAIRLASSVDAVIIISGDGDFVPLVEYLKFNSGCQVEVATFKSTASASLIEVSDDFFDLTEDLDRYLIKKYRNNFRPYKKIHNKEGAREDHGVDIDDKISDKTTKLERETPEMISERISGKRGVPVLKRGHSQVKKEKIKTEDKKEIKERVPKEKKATEVEISRVKKEDFIVPKELKKKVVTKEVKPAKKKELNKTKIIKKVKKNLEK